MRTTIALATVLLGLALAACGTARDHDAVEFHPSPGDTNPADYPAPTLTAVPGEPTPTPLNPLPTKAVPGTLSAYSCPSGWQVADDAAAERFAGGYQAAFRCVRAAPATQIVFAVSGDGSVTITKVTEEAAATQDTGRAL